MSDDLDRWRLSRVTTQTLSDAALRTLSCEAVAEYLRRSGWHAKEDYADATWMRLPGAPGEPTRATVFLPKRADHRHFLPYMEEVVDVLARVEGRTQEEVLLALGGFVA